MNYKLIKESIRSKNKAISFLLDSKVQCQNCKHFHIYHYIYEKLKPQISNSYYYSNSKRYKKGEKISYFCHIKNHDVLKFAQCNKFDFKSIINRSK